MTPDEYVLVLAWVYEWGWVPAMPVCPGCGGQPVLILGDGHQAFCGANECEVLTWDPAQDSATFWGNAREVKITPTPPD